MKQHIALFGAAVICGLSTGLLSAPRQCDAATLFYLSGKGAGEGAAPVDPQESLVLDQSTGSFHIWVQPDTLFTGISLNVARENSAIRFTGSTVHNPTVASDKRWLPDFIRNGSVSDSEVTRIEGGALAPLTGYGTGIGPTTTALDPLHEASGGFLFATISYAVDTPSGEDSVSLSIGHNLLSDTSGLYSGSIFLGFTDGPVANLDGTTGSVVDLKFIPQQTADFDSDGEVDAIDFLILQRGLGITSGATRSQGDGNGDGKVDAADLQLWESQYGTSPLVAASFAVPEATTRTLWLSGSLLGLVICGRRHVP